MPFNFLATMPGMENLLANHHRPKFSLYASQHQATDLAKNGRYGQQNIILGTGRIFQPFAYP